MLGTPSHRGFVPWVVSPQLPEMHQRLGHQAGLSPCSKPRGWGGLCSLRADSASISHQSNQCRSPPQGWGVSPGLPSPQYQLVSSSHPTRSCGGTAGTAGAGQGTVTICRVGVGRGGALGVRGAQNCMAPLGSHCSRRTMDGSLLAPRMNSSSESFPAGKGTRLSHPPAPETTQSSPWTSPHPGGAPWGALHPEPLHTSRHELFNQRACGSL